MKSIALVVGEGHYVSQTKLKESLKDADDMAAALTRLGYNVIPCKDSGLYELGKKIGEFQSEAENYEVALFYFSGHGIMDNGENYLCPIDLESKSTKTIINTSKKLEDIMAGMPDNLKVKIFIIDACRTDIKDMKGLGKGICPTNAPKGSLVAFATSPGVEADADGPNGNSMYTACLLKYIETKGIAVEECFKRVRTELYKISNEAQWSWEHTSLIGDYYFNNEPLKKNIQLEDYKGQALADMNFISDTSDEGVVVSLLKTHDWYKQKDGYTKFCTLQPKNVEKNFQFVIGRNLVQAACGDSIPVVEYFKNIGLNLLKWQQNDGSNHLLNGMLYEMYFNREGNFRGIGMLKTGVLDILLALEEDHRFFKSFEFIRNCLIPYSSVLYYIPSNKEPDVEVYIEFIKVENAWYPTYEVQSIKYQGTEIYEKIEFTTTFSRSKDDFFILLQGYFGVPKTKIKFVTNIPKENIDSEISVQYPLRLDVPKRN